jgi:hypothetical protein
MDWGSNLRCQIGLHNVITKSSAGEAGFAGIELNMVMMADLS